jgi:Domain of unknown function (DUF4249)
MKKFIAISFILLFLSCRKDVVLVLPEYKQKVVIEASIETGSPAIVFLSYSVPYFSDFDYSAPEKAFIKGATVVISDGSKSETLLQLDPTNGYLYIGTKLLGEKGKTYTIKVTVAGKTFETNSSIGAPPPQFDSLYFKTERDSLGFIWQRLSEPKGTGDNYRWFAKRLGRDQFYAAPFNSTFDDKFIDGKAFDFGYDRGPQPNQLQQNREDPERGFYKKGDTVVVKFCKIGTREYDFWNTYYQNKSSNGNPFSSPSNIKNMFDAYEDAFGAFVAYSPRFDTIIIPKK